MRVRQGRAAEHDNVDQCLTNNPISNRRDAQVPTYTHRYTSLAPNVAAALDHKSQLVEGASRARRAAWA
jgi:hypothetical protein